jgi:hypothetical protein
MNVIRCVAKGVILGAILSILLMWFFAFIYGAKVASLAELFSAFGHIKWVLVFWSSCFMGFVWGSIEFETNTELGKAIRIFGNITDFFGR